MRKFVVLLISMSLSLPVYAKETPAPPPRKGSNGTVMLRGQDATTPAAKPTEPAKPAETAAAPAAAPAEAAPAATAAPAASAPAQAAPATAAPAAAAKGEPSAADRLKWPKEIQNAWDQGNNTVKNLILNRIKAGGSLNDKEFKKRVADTLAESQGKKVAASPKSQKKGAVAAQSVQQGPPVPVVDAGAGGEEAPPAATVRRTRTQPAQRNRDDAYGDVKDKDTDAKFRCTDGTCNGTQPGSVLAPQQEDTVRTIVEHTPRESGSDWKFDWGSGALGFGAGILGTLLFQKFMNNNNNNYQQYCGFGPGGQGVPWWQYPYGRPGVGQLPAVYRAPGTGFGVGGFGSSYPPGIPGQSYGGGFGVGAPPQTLPFPGPTQVGANMFQSNAGYNNLYNTGFNQLGVQQNLFGNPSMGVPNIVLGR